MGRRRLTAFMQSDQWWPQFDKVPVLELPGCPWNVRECAAAGDAFVHTSELNTGTRNCFSTYVVPVEWHSTVPRLVAAAGVHHLDQTKHQRRPKDWTFEGCLGQ